MDAAELRQWSFCEIVAAAAFFFVLQEKDFANLTKSYYSGGANEKNLIEKKGLMRELNSLKCKNTDLRGVKRFFCWNVDLSLFCPSTISDPGCWLGGQGSEVTRWSEAALHPRQASSPSQVNSKPPSSNSPHIRRIFRAISHPSDAGFGLGEENMRPWLTKNSWVEIKPPPFWLWLGCWVTVFVTASFGL